MTAYEQVACKLSLTPVARTNGTTNGTAIDTAAWGGCDTVLAVWFNGNLTDGVHTVSVEQSDSSGSGFAAVAAVEGTAPVTNAATDDNTEVVFGVNPTKRWIRMVCVTSGATTGGIAAGGFVFARNRFTVR